MSGRIFDMGLFKIPLLMASLFVVAATFLIAECKEYWQFLLCQGFAVGVSALSDAVFTYAMTHLPMNGTSYLVA